MSEMKVGNIAPTGEIEPKFSALRVGVLTITLPRLPDVTTLTKFTCLYG